MSLINVKNMTFGYDENDIFKNVSFQIDTNWRLGFTGRNGRGKTTFLNLLLGKYEYRGSISSDVQFEYFPYETHEEYTIDCIKEICPNAFDWEIIKELSLINAEAELLYRPISTLSHGERTKALLCGMFLRENSFLLIDEPTNHLDTEGRNALGNYLRMKHGFILVSHDRALLDCCTDHTLSINKTNIDIQKGNFSSWYANKQLEDSFEINKNEKLKKEITSLSESAKKAASWSNAVEKTKCGTKIAGLRPDRGNIGHRAAKMMKRSKNLENRLNKSIDEKSSLLKNIETADKLKIHPLDFHSNRLISLNGVSISYSKNTVCENINFTVSKGDRISLKGKNGSGKSSILKLISGENIDMKGELYKANNLKISYASQDYDGLCGTLSDYAQNYAIDESLFKTILRKFGFERSMFDKDISGYSGGQKKKVILARSLCESANVYIWDEPLNYIDIFSRMQIEELILSYKPTLIFVEHDSVFCDKISTKTIEL